MAKQVLFSPSQWKQSGKYTSFRDFQIFYQDTASNAPVLLCIHGFPTSSWDWQWIWEGISQHFRVIAPDMLGFGFSDKPAKHRYTIHEQADLHEALLEELGIEEYSILAHDYGDTVAQELLARQGEGKAKAKITKLCFLNGGIFPEMHRPRPIQTLLLSPLGGLANRFISKSVFAKTLNRILGKESQLSPEVVDKYWEIITYQNGQQRGHQLMRYMLDRREHRDRWVHILQKTEVPLCLINGVVDPVSGGHAANYYEQIIPNPRVVRLSQIGHYPQVEAAEATLEAFLDFALGNELS